MASRIAGMILLWALVVPGLALAEGRRMAIVVGSNRGLATEGKLDFAVADATATANVLTELGGVKKEDLRLLHDPTALAFLEAVSRAASALEREPDSMLLVYYSGHGNARQLHMNDTIVWRSELGRMLSTSNVGFSLLVIDSCRNEGTKGVRLAPDATGNVAINSASLGQISIEVDSLRSGLFSYYWVSGLRGAADANANGKVDLHEATWYVRESVGAASSDMGVPAQMPEEDSRYRLKAVPILTWVWRADARLVLPAGPGTYYRVVRKGSEGRTVAGVEGKDSGTEVALPAGQFVVHRFEANHRHRALESDGEWQSLGLVRQYTDVRPPEPLTARVGAWYSATRAAVELGVLGDAAPVASPPRARTYRVRAEAGELSGPESAPVAIQPSVGTLIRYRWERSSVGPDGPFEPLASAVGSPAEDVSAPLGAERWYRVRLETEGAAGVSDVQLATPRSVRSLAFGWMRGRFGSLRSNPFCVLSTDGGAECHGVTLPSQLQPGTYSTLAAGRSHTCGLLESGQVSCSGRIGTPASTYRTIASGATDVCGIRDEDGSLDCWGEHSPGQALATSTASPPPPVDAVLTPPTGSFEAVAVSTTYACALDARGELTCWGADVTLPAAAGTFRALSAATTTFDNRMCGIRTDGTVACWGDGGLAASTPPGEFSQVSVGYDHACALEASGRAQCWLAERAVDDAAARPPEGTFGSIFSGVEETCALPLDGPANLICWGSSHSRRPPAQRLTALSVGLGHACGLDLEGRIACWGRPGNIQGAPTEARYRAVSAGGAQACALDDAGLATCWGANLAVIQNAPSAPLRALTVGQTFACGIRTADSTVTCWGAAGDTLLGASDGPFDVLWAGGGSVCAARADGSGGCKGTTELSFTLDPDAAPDADPSLPDAYPELCVMGTFGAYYCRDDEPGAVYRGPEAERFADGPFRALGSVAASEVCGILADDSVRCWDEGSLTPPYPPAVESFRLLTPLRTVHAGAKFNCGLDHDGFAHCWDSTPIGGLFL